MSIVPDRQARLEAEAMENIGLRAKVHRLERENRALREALRKHGRHWARCSDPATDATCRCGLSAALGESGEEGK